MMRPFVMLLALLPVVPASAATLRPFTTLERRVVRLSDLWDGVVKDRDIGPAPAPGARILVEAPQLAAIARQFGVDWEPATPGDRAIIERAGQPLAREAVIAALRSALGAAGAPADADVEVAAFSAPVVAAESAAAPGVSQLSYDASSGLFTALVSVAGDGTIPAETRVSGRVVAMQDALVPVRTIGAGEVVGAADLRIARVRAARWSSGLVQSAEQAVGYAPLRPLLQGQPIAAVDLRRPLMVRKGATVRMVLTTPGIALTAEGIAMSPAGMGERLRVLNPSSKVLVEAEATGPGEVRVMPGTAPVPAGGAAAGWALAQGGVR